MRKLKYQITFLIFIIQGCAFIQHSNSIKFIGSDYVSYQYNDIRVYIPYFSEKQDSIDSCDPRKQLEFLFDSEVIDGFQLAELLQQHLPENSFLKKAPNDYSNFKKCVDDYENYRGRIIYFEMVFFEKSKDRQKKLLELYANTTGWSPGPIIDYQIEIISNQFKIDCIDNLKNANQIKLKCLGLQL